MHCADEYLVVSYTLPSDCITSFDLTISIVTRSLLVSGLMLNAQSVREDHAVQAAQRGPSRTESLRALSILERLAAMEDHSPSRGLVMQLSDALLPILATSAGSGHRRTRGDDAAMLRVLGVLAAIWTKAAERSTQGVHCWH